MTSSYSNGDSSGSSMVDPQLPNGTGGGPYHVSAGATAPPQQQHTTSLVMPPQQDVDDFLRKKRKVREHKACYPCRQRKVKCDLSRPCQTCRDREHPELCSYHPPNKRQSTDSGPVLKIEDGPAQSTSYQVGRADFDMVFQKLSAMENSISELRRELHRRTSEDHRPASAQSRQPVKSHSPSQPFHPPPKHTDVHGIHTRNEAGEIVHFGAGSIPAMLYALGQSQSGQRQPAPYEGRFDFNGPSSTQHQLQEVLGKSVLPLFALDNESVTYPFVDLWGLPHASLQRAQELAKALPGDEQLLNLWRSYRDLGWAIYPGMADPRPFEESLTGFLLNRTSQATSSDGVTEQVIYGRSFCWLGLLFAVLASGAQCGAMPRKDRELTSQVYVCCAFECLRFTNFLSQPHIESIQTLLVIGNVMTNNMNAGSAWSLLGLTIRLAQGLGLHRSCPPNVPKGVIHPRSRVWWAIVWQDSLLSITYDRTSSTASVESSTMKMPQNFSITTGYHASMYRLCKVGLDIVRDRARVIDPREHYSIILEHRESIMTINREAAEYLRDTRKCVNKRETIEHWGYNIHCSYALSELYRPAISQSSGDYELSKAFGQACIECLADAVEAYIGLHTITAFARQSWAAIHRSLSSALLLGILGEHAHNERARVLLGRYLGCMDEITESVDPQEISAPVQRGISALKQLDIPTSPSSSASTTTHVQQNRPPQTGTVGGVAQQQQPQQNPQQQQQQQQHQQQQQNADGRNNGGSSIMTPAATENSSPYSVVNSILWGNATSSDFKVHPETFVVQPPL